MTFHSILFGEREEDGVRGETPNAPAFSTDLHIDQIVDSITAEWREYDLKPFFYTTLHDADTIEYRFEIMRDLESDMLVEKIITFTKEMRIMRKHLDQSAKLYYKYQKESLFLDAIETYCQAICRLAEELTNVELQSRGFLAFREYLIDYVQSDGFTALLAETEKLRGDLSNVCYCLHIKDNWIKVEPYEDQLDLPQL